MQSAAIGIYCLIINILISLLTPYNDVIHLYFHYLYLYKILWWFCILFFWPPLKLSLIFLYFTWSSSVFATLLLLQVCRIMQQLQWAAKISKLLQIILFGDTTDTLVTVDSYPDSCGHHIWISTLACFTYIFVLYFNLLRLISVFSDSTKSVTETLMIECNGTLIMVRDTPVIFALTATYTRMTQKADLTRLA